MTNNSLITGKKYIKDIFGQEEFYNIPEYQRPYVWGADQIENFLEDITNAMESNKDKEYFLGCMIWNTREHTSNGITYKFQDILDGQQRFLTLFLLHTVLRNLSLDDKLKENVQKRLIQEADEFNNIPARNRIEFDIRDDKEFIDKYLIPKNSYSIDILQIIEDNKDTTTSVRNLAVGLIIMLNWFKRKENQSPENFHQFVSDFYKYLSTKVLALYLATPNNLDDAYNLFTVLNSRGLQLQVSDILRAQNLRVINDERIRRTYANKWGEFENKITFPYKSFDEFLWSLVFIKMKYRSNDNQSLTKAFEHMFRRELLSKGTDTLDFIEKYVNHFVAITNSSISSKESGNIFSNLNYILSNVYGAQYLTPLMHYRECFGDNNIIDFLIKLDNLFSLAWLTGRRQSTTRTFIIIRKIDAYYEKVKSGELTSYEASKEMINDPCIKFDYYDEQISSEKPLFVKDLKNLLETEKWGNFSGSKVNKTRYVLLKLDLLLSNKNTYIQFNKNSSSIEHIMPQKLDSYYWDIDPEFHKEWLHRLGNLVLIDRNKNSSLSNKDFLTKKQKYQGAYETRANTNYVLFNYSKWDKESILENHKRIIAILTKYYEGNSVNTFVDFHTNTI